jgi:site-specific DNA-methyltransferase (adenine-specific)
MTYPLHHGDFLNVLRDIDSESVDSFITDPPYGIDYQSAWRIDKSQRLPKIKNDARPFIWWLNDAHRVAKSNGCLICFCRWDVQEAFRLAIQWAGFRIRSQVIWDRQHHGLGGLETQFAPQHDVIWFATKGAFKFPNHRPKSIIAARRIAGDKLTHPNEKPVPLMRDLIKGVTKTDGIVLDPFMGSGATGVACVISDRNFIGIEMDQKYYSLAQHRIEDAANPLRHMTERAT